MKTIKKQTQNHLKSQALDQFIFEKTFDQQLIQECFDQADITFRKRIYSPDVLLWCLINQVLDDDQSCRNAVAKFIAKRSVVNESLISSSTGGFCQARSRLPLELLINLSKKIFNSLDSHIENIYWNGLNVKMIDGSEVRMPVTQENEKIYPHYNDSNGLLKARLLGVFSLSHGGLIDLEISPYIGKGNGELSLFRRILSSFKSSDLLLMDRLFCSYADFEKLDKNNIKFIVRQKSEKTNCQKVIKSLGRKDHLVKYSNPPTLKKEVERGDMSASIILRRVTIDVKRNGFRSKKLILLTNLLDPKKYSKKELENLYLKRWNVEVDFRSLKTFLKMDVLRCKTPAMIKKEIWTHVLCYNYIRVIMADASMTFGVPPREISFKETLQQIKAIRPYMAINDIIELSNCYYETLLTLTDRVGNRPGRIEPRLVRNNKRRYRLLKIDREEAKKGYYIRGTAYQTRKKELNGTR